jgi:heme oxygenase
MTKPAEDALPISQALRETLSPQHEAIENTALARRMAGGAVGREEYVRLLQNLFAIHATLEPALAASPPVSQWLTPHATRAPALAADLAFWQARPLDFDRLEAPTRRLVGLFRGMERQRPVPLIGALYIFEGSRMGARILKSRVAAALGTTDEQGHGVDYFAVGSADHPARWAQFKRRLDEAVWAARERTQLLAGARRTMRGLLTLYRVIGDDAG